MLRRLAVQSQTGTRMWTRPLSQLMATRCFSTPPPAATSNVGTLMDVDEDVVEKMAAEEAMAPKLPRGTRVGIVKSTKMNKTITVGFYKRKYVPKYDVYYRKKVKVFAHDEAETCEEGDMVRVVPGEKRTRRKNYELESIIKKRAR